MSYTPALLPAIITAIVQIINDNAEAVTELDQAIGDGDHVINLQRGLHALQNQSADLATAQDWASAWQKIGMTLMSTVGGASGSLFGTLLVTLSKAAKEQTLDLAGFSEAFAQGVNAVKLRGKADVGEKTMLDVLIPVANYLQTAANQGQDLTEVFGQINTIAEQGVEATRDMLATKGRASFLAERSLGHIDAGAKTSQLMISAIITVLATEN
ncbi:MAG: dihydroxyacetone kinase subunit DhaL [Methylococcaceae bacterium]